MNIKRILNQLNVARECKKYGLSLWQCPQFLFLVMGIIIICSCLLAFAIGNRYIEDPRIVALVVLFLTLILFIIAYTITRSFERLAEAARMKSEFISVVSHQLRSPLTNLKWVIEILMSGKVGKIEDRQAEYFKILRENSVRMGELISDLLTVSKIETTTLPFKKREFSLEKLASELILEFQPFAIASNVTLNFKEPKDLPKVLADFSQIRQVIGNLLDNAIRYTKNRGEVIVKVQERRKNIYFEITDTGVGIPEEDQRYVFQKFFRSKNVLRYQTLGSGLGLFIAKSIIERSGGKIGFKSEENKGTTFWFTLPIK